MDVVGYGARVGSSEGALVGFRDGGGLLLGLAEGGFALVGLRVLLDAGFFVG